MLRKHPRKWSVAVLVVLAISVASTAWFAPPAEPAPTGCTPSVRVGGDGCIGGSIDYKVCAKPGCHVCLLVSFDNGPLHLLGETIKIGPPFLPLFDGPIPSSGCKLITLPLPDAKVLVGAKLYYQAVGVEIRPALKLRPGTHGFTLICDPKAGGGDDDDDE